MTVESKRRARVRMVRIQHAAVSACSSRHCLITAAAAKSSFAARRSAAAAAVFDMRELYYYYYYYLYILLLSYFLCLPLRHAVFRITLIYIPPPRDFQPFLADCCSR